jgi:hypothetical protein
MEIPMREGLAPLHAASATPSIRMAVGVNCDTSVALPASGAGPADPPVAAGETPPMRKAQAAAFAILFPANLWMGPPSSPVRFFVLTPERPA